MIKKILTGIIILFALIGLFLTFGYIAVYFGWTNTKGVIDKQRQDFLGNNTIETNTKIEQTDIQSWQNTPEWQTLKTAIIKDKEIINRASLVSGTPARLIVENLVAEQLRFFFDDRESYKKFFEPLKILGSTTKFSLGVMGVKEHTAIAIENNLKDKNSVFYPGKEYENLLDFNTEDISKERFTRMTDQHDHFWSYLYAGLYIRQITKQWNTAGFDISEKPDIIATLYNVGFNNSKPHLSPISGGAEIKIGNQKISFGKLANSFYYSNELLEEFPR